MLAQLNEIEGVESTSASLGERPALLQVTLRPGADSAKVAQAVRRVLGNEFGDRSPTQLQGAAAAAALQKESWLDQDQIIGLATENRLSYMLASLLIGGLMVGAVALLYWCGRADTSKQSQPAMSPSSSKMTGFACAQVANLGGR